MFFSARKVRADKPTDKKEPLISKHDIVNLLKEAINGISDSTLR
jgi:hypothetical protein